MLDLQLFINLRAVPDAMSLTLVKLRDTCRLEWMNIFVCPKKLVNN